jgi:hypothetical protein
MFLSIRTIIRELLLNLAKITVMWCKRKGTQHTPQPETPTPFLTTLLHINDVILLIITTQL